jgi:hypothetical protein
MAAENESAIDYGAILSDLEAKKTAIETAIAGLRAMMGMMGSSEGMSYVKSEAALVNSSIHGGEIPAGAFLGKSIPESAKLYLSIAKSKKTTREIADALRKGGMETSSTNFENIVHAGLTRTMKSAGAFLRVGKSWALPEWYPAGVRSAAVNEKRKPRKAKRRNTERRDSAMQILPAKAEQVMAEGHHPAKLWERAVAFLKEHPNQEFTSLQLSEKFGIHAKVISMTLARPVKDGLIKMSAPGTYSAR